MNTPPTPVDPGTGARPMTEEADIGSGEKSPGHAETEAMIRQIPPLPPSGSDDAPSTPAGASTPS